MPRTSINYMHTVCICTFTKGGSVIAQTQDRFSFSGALLLLCRCSVGPWTFWPATTITAAIQLPQNGFDLGRMTQFKILVPFIIQFLERMKQGTRTNVTAAILSRHCRALARQNRSCDIGLPW